MLLRSIKRTERLSVTVARVMAKQNTVPRRNMGAKVLSMDTLNPHVKLMEYAVRGPIVARAVEIEKELQQVGNAWLHYGIEDDFAQISFVFDAI